MPTQVLLRSTQAVPQVHALRQSHPQVEYFTHIEAPEIYPVMETIISMIILYPFPCIHHNYPSYVEDSIESETYGHTDTMQILLHYAVVLFIVFKRLQGK